MKKNWVKKVFRCTLLLIFALVSVSALGQVKADALADGSYTVPAKAINKETGATSAAEVYLGSTANVVVNNGTYKVSVPITSTGQAALKAASVDQSSILNGSNLTFTMTDETPKVLVDYHIVVAAGPFHMDMTPSAYEEFDWSKVTAVMGSGTSTPGQQGGTPAPGQQGGTPAPGQQGGTPAPGQQGGTPAPGQQGGTPATNDNKANQINYTVLQANDKSTSAANQFYTQKADVKKLTDGSYQVTMYVQYGKNSGMSAKGFVPLTVNGQKVSNVTYGSIGEMYTASFSFTVPTHDALTKAPIKGTIHVSVPTMGMNSDFNVYYNFAGTSTADGTDLTNTPTPGTDSSSVPSGFTPVTNNKISKMSYKVLQANDKSISEANKFYTHKADIKKLANGSYQVTMYVQYGKNSGMSAKGFVPLTVMGHKVSNVTYGSTDKMYTASFSFTVPTLADLTKAPIKGTIHVSVPMVGISSDFDIYYQFTGVPVGGGTDTTNAAKTAAAGAKAVPGKGSSSKAKARVEEQSSGRLPQTSDVQNGAVALVGIISVVLVTLTAIIRKKSAQ